MTRLILWRTLAIQRVSGRMGDLLMWEFLQKVGGEVLNRRAQGRRSSFRGARAPASLVCLVAGTMFEQPDASPSLSEVAME